MSFKTGEFIRIFLRELKAFSCGFPQFTLFSASFLVRSVSGNYSYELSVKAYQSKKKIVNDAWFLVYLLLELPLPYLGWF